MEFPNLFNSRKRQIEEDKHNYGSLLDGVWRRKARDRCNPGRSPLFFKWPGSNEIGAILLNQTLINDIPTRNIPREEDDISPAKTTRNMVHWLLHIQDYEPVKSPEPGDVSYLRTTISNLGGIRDEPVVPLHSDSPGSTRSWTVPSGESDWEPRQAKLMGFLLTGVVAVAGTVRYFYGVDVQQSHKLSHGDSSA